MAEPFVGEVKLFAFPFAPRHYALCNGQLLSISQNAALFSLLGTTYGGNGVTTFALPNLQGRTPVHYSTTFPLGELAGVEAVTLTTETMPTHTHPLIGTSAIANRKTPKQDMFGNDTSPVTQFYGAPTSLVAIAPETLTSAGGSQPHPNMQPYLVANYCIALTGIFPSRN